MKHEFDLEQIDYDNSNYELDIWSSCFNPIFSPPSEVIKEWNLQFDDDWDEPEPTLENTSVYFTEDGANYLIVGKTIIPVSEHFAETGKTVTSSVQSTKLKTALAYSTIRVRSIVSVGCFKEGGFE